MHNGDDTCPGPSVSPSSMIDLCWEEHHGKNFPKQRPTPINMVHRYQEDHSCDTDKEDVFTPESYFTPKVANPLNGSVDRNNASDPFSRFNSGSNSGLMSRVPSNDSSDANGSAFPIFQVQNGSHLNQYQTPPMTPQYQPLQQQQQQTPTHQVQKCRQLPCRTFISTGSCPYGDRCVFLHDARITAKPVYVRSKRKTKDDQCVDAFFWPTMPFNTVMGTVDNRNQPHIAQPYLVPVPVGCSTASINGTGSSSNNNNNEVAVFSMWEHFIDFLKSDSLSVVTVPRVVPTLDPHATMNPHTGKARLPVLKFLGETESRKSNSNTVVSTANFNSNEKRGTSQQQQMQSKYEDPLSLSLFPQLQKQQQQMHYQQHFSQQQYPQQQQVSVDSLLGMPMQQSLQQPLWLP